MFCLRKLTLDDFFHLKNQLFVNHAGHRLKHAYDLKKLTNLRFQKKQVLNLKTKNEG